MAAEIQGPRVEDQYGLWLTWEVADGPFWRYEQRRLTRIEGIMWRLFKRVPEVEHGDH